MMTFMQAGLAAAPAVFSGIRSPVSVMSEWSFKGHFPVAVLCLKVPHSLEPQCVSVELDKAVAAMVNLLFISGMKEDDYKAVMGDVVTLRPRYCHALTQVDCYA